MKIGFTGTRRGLTKGQKIELRKSLSLVMMSGNEFHHGDCIGADAEAHTIAKRMGYKIIIHPPKKSTARAFCKGSVILPAKDYIPRNHDIVKASDIVIACPGESCEVLRSGTWATIRFARKNLKKRPIIIYPDGRIWD